MNLQIRRLAAPRCRTDADILVAISFRGHDFQITRQWCIDHSITTPAELKQAFITWATGRGFTPAQLQALRDHLHIHRNRDGTIALAAGQAPAIWPEDQDEPR